MMKHDVERIPLRLAGEPGARYGAEPLTFGVPFAEGAFPSGSALRCVTADGRELPLQTAVMTTWKPDLQHVKWLLADLQADPRRDGETVWLEAGGGEVRACNRGTGFQPVAGTDGLEARPTGESGNGEAKVAIPSIAIAHAGGLLTIDTGALRLTLRTEFPRWVKREWDSPFVGCEVRVGEAWRETLQGPGILLYMRDQHGNLYTSLGGCPASRVMIEEQGPLRVCVLITGHLMSEQGVRFCPYRLRIHLYAGKADLRLLHTFVFDQDPTRIELKEIGVKVFAGTGNGAVADVGRASCPSLSSLSRQPDAGTGKMPVPRPQCAGTDDAGWQEISLLQSDDIHYTVTRDGQPVDAGEKAPGWACLSGSNAGVVAAVRDFWQEYPKGFAVSPGELDVRIWPEDAPEPLRFVTPFDEPAIYFNGTRDEAEIKRLLAERPTAPLDLQSFAIRNMDDLRWVEEVMERLAPDRARSYCDFMGQGTGIGAAKTTEIILRFTPGPVSPAEAAAFAAAVQEPLFAIVDPGYLCGTGVLGHFLPAGEPRFAELDRFLTAILDRSMIEPLERCRRYGMMMNGQMVNAHTGRHGPPAADLVYQLYKDTAPDKALRHVGPYGNEALDIVMGVWGQFLRTGERRYLRQAQVTARAVADVSFVHAYPGDEDNIGCIHYHGPHVWSNSLNRSHSVIGAFMADYYLTGNRRSREVALEAADGIVNNKLEPCGIVNCFAALHREFTGPLSILMEAYQLTWHEKYGDPARRSLAWLLRAVRTPGCLPRSIYTGGPRGAEAVVEPECGLGDGACNTYYIFEPALRLFPSQRLKECLCAFAEHRCRIPSTTYGIANLCLAYDLTKKREYAAAAFALVAAHRVRPLAPQESLSFYTPAELDWVPRLMRTAVQAAAADPGFWEFARRWMEERAANPVRPPDPAAGQPKTASLGVLGVEPLVDEWRDQSVTAGVRS